MVAYWCWSKWAVLAFPDMVAIERRTCVTEAGKFRARVTVEASEWQKACLDRVKTKHSDVNSGMTPTGPR